MKNPVKVIALLLTNWPWAVSQPKIARAAFLAHATTLDAFYAALLHALIICCGDWRAAARFMAEHGHDLQRLKKFESWAAKLTAPAKRGLLIGWKGGAS